ncbi:MAG TPA: SDR family oxidoreductase [Saprospiraceae bacterium]|nr:SDR family oxidoreductase [Saprospiraceae bacterium]HND88060.1 SDR family oxidoreductase [Saprospiraceae bacterium]HNG88805.1 SDR family oxidoreductase [Saprospiraceae bacterium]
MAYFSNKRIWITGASSGIGEALALAFAGQGAHLILSSRKEQELQRVAAAATQAGAQSVLVQPLDLAQHALLPAVAERVLKQVGKIDLLLNNGGISQRALALDTTLDVDKKLMDVNYFGTVALSKAVLPTMLTHQLGHIATITSLTGKFGSPYRSSYAASKHALHGFFDSLRAELAHTPIKITLLCPGFIKTNVSVNALTGDGSQLGVMDDAQAKGMSPEVLAQKILRTLEAGKEEAYYGGKEVLGVYLKRFFPAYFSKVLRKAKVR